MQIAIIGGGAAGFFSAITAKENNPEARVVIFEKSDKVLAKVKISGGGRCNVTNGCDSISGLCDAYPRGGKALKKAFHNFNNKDTIKWFETRGVPLVIQDDQRVFPKSGHSQTIIDCLVNEAKRLGVEINILMPVKEIIPIGDQLQIGFVNEDQKPELFDRVIVTTGGSPKRSGLEWLEKLGHKIEAPVPSLFSFNIKNDDITELMGVSVDTASLRIQGTKLVSEGSLLVTHWGLSGPAILKLSSFGARILSEMHYKFKVQVNWTGIQNNELVLNDLKELAQSHPGKLLSNFRPFGIPGRIWGYLLEKVDQIESKTWRDLSKKDLNRIVNILTNDVYEVDGRTTFKDEFVTCGGVSLENVNMGTMESKVCKNLNFAGEVLDIDAITGGFNLQAAWTTGWIAGRALRSVEV
jgi:predicted Rossmann fold flavoprotein